MIENSLVKKILKGIKRGKKSALVDRHIMHPEREWFTTLFVGLVLVFAGAYWSFNTYLKFSEVGLHEEVSESGDIIYRESLINAALFEIETRAQTYESLKQNVEFTAPEPVEVEETVLEPEEEITPVFQEDSDLDIILE